VPECDTGEVVGRRSKSAAHNSPGLLIHINAHSDLADLIIIEWLDDMEGFGSVKIRGLAEYERRVQAK
jgi:hypothetical protein